MKHIHIVVQGKVQGVFFRKTTKQVAQELKLVGTVQNLTNGNVQIEVEGEERVLTQFLAFCKEGPERANVTDLHTEEKAVVGYSDFKII